MNYILLNGAFHPENEPVLKTSNRAFSYGDSIFESMRWHRNKILFALDHFERFNRAVQLLKMKSYSGFTLSYLDLQVKELIAKNNINGAARIRLQVFRNEGGYYTPSDNSTGYVLSAETLQDNEYTLNESGLKTNFFRELKKNIHPVSNYKTGNSGIYTLAGFFVNENNLDDCFISNMNDVITDASSSNVFIIKNNTVFTSPVAEGCIDGVMRRCIIKILENEKISFYETPVYENDILLADEVFITNTIRGIRWIATCGDKKFTNTITSNIFQKFLLAVG